MKKPICVMTNVQGESVSERKRGGERGVREPQGDSNNKEFLLKGIGEGTMTVSNKEFLLKEMGEGTIRDSNKEFPLKKNGSSIEYVTFITVIKPLYWRYDLADFARTFFNL